MERYCAVFKLVERCIVIFVDLNEVLLKSFKFIFILWILLY